MTKDVKKEEGSPNILVRIREYCDETGESFEEAITRSLRRVIERFED